MSLDSRLEWETAQLYAVRWLRGDYLDDGSGPTRTAEEIRDAAGVAFARSILSCLSLDPRLGDFFGPLGRTKYETRPRLFCGPDAFARLPAHNLAARYRPEGLP